jgi:NitT/TauT family transport system permease protein
MTQTTTSSPPGVLRAREVRAAPPSCEAVADAGPSLWRRMITLRAELPRWLYAVIAILSFTVVLTVWCIVSYGGYASPVFLPTPTAVAERAGRLWDSGLLTRDLWISNVRIMSGFFLAALVAVPLGMLAGNLRAFEAALEPLIGFVRYMPVPAFIPLLMLYTGIGETPKILVIFIGTVVQMTVMIADVTKGTQADLIRVSMALGANRVEVFTRVIWPASLPGIFDVARLNLGFAWTYLVVAELVAANEGLGHRILKSQRFLQTDTIFLYLFIIGLLGLTSDMLFKLAQKRLFRWAEERVTA